MNYTPTYLGEISLDEETLAHYGVKGMKWGKRLRSALKNNPISKRRRKNRYIASHLANDLADGRRKLTTTNEKKYSGAGYVSTKDPSQVRIYRNRSVAALSKYGRKDSKYPTISADNRSQVETTTLRDLQKAQDSLRRRKKK